jgi:hypothetical protein
MMRRISRQVPELGEDVTRWLERLTRIPETS